MVSRRTNHQPRLALPRRRVRFGFTLVEVLIVIVVIAILAALLLPAINGALQRGRIVAEYNEITQLSLALQEFKNKYGVYPPSRIRLREGSSYDPDNAFDAHSIKWLKRVWPDLQLPSDTNWIIWCKDDPDETESNREARSGYTPQTYDLEGDECLVFFLGGVAEFDRSNINARPIVLHGFTDNPRNPGGVPDASLSITQARIQPLFEFKADRLFVRTPSTHPPSDFGLTTRTANKLPSYKTSLAPAMEVPYAYFSSYEGAGYRPRDCEFEGEPTEKLFQEVWPSVTTSTTGHIASQGPNPYYITVAAPNDDSTIVKAYLPQKFQLIAPGGDGLFGPGGSLGVRDEPAAGGQNGDENDAVYGTLYETEKDNISNVTEGGTVGEHFADKAQ